MDKIKKILKFAMRMEKDAGDFYSYYADKVNSSPTKDLFRELAETEKHHYEILKAKFDELGFEEPPASISWVVDNNFSSKDPHILAGSSDILGNSEDEISDISIIRMAYLMENDFSEFYKNAIDAVEDEDSKKFLKTLYEWETQHKDTFYERYNGMMKKYWGSLSEIIFTK